jgi:hypothetical protein
MTEARLHVLSSAGDTTAPAEVTCRGSQISNYKNCFCETERREQKCHPKGLAVYYVE